MTEEEKVKRKRTFCRDCVEKGNCDKDPLECMKTESANLYFEIYDKTYTDIRRGN